MNRLLLSLLLLLAVRSISNAQGIDAMLKAVEKDMVYPVMKSHPFMGVLPVLDPALQFDPKQRHKVAIDLTMPYQDSSKASFGITEIGRTFNLHVVNGAPKENIEMVVIVHGPAIRTFLTDELYSKRNGIANPNIPILQELSRNGVKFYVCGQSLAILKMKRESFIPELQVSLSAKTAITEFQAKGYSFLYFQPD